MQEIKEKLESVMIEILTYLPAKKKNKKTKKHPHFVQEIPLTVKRSQKVSFQK